MQYRKKPVVVEAWQLTVEAAHITSPREKRMPDWLVENEKVSPPLFLGNINTIHIKIDTLGGTMTASNGDFIIKGVHGEIYPCKPDIFEETYEAVSAKG